jgi:hypothetical protein
VAFLNNLYRTLPSNPSSSTPSGLDRLARYPHLMQSIFPSNSPRPPPVPGTPDYPLKIEVPYFPEIPFGSETRIETRPADSRALVNEMIAKTSVAFRSAEYDPEDFGPVRTPSEVSTPSAAKLNSSGIFNQQWSGSIALQEMASPPRENKTCQRYDIHLCLSRICPGFSYLAS